MAGCPLGQRADVKMLGEAVLRLARWQAVRSDDLANAIEWHARGRGRHSECQERTVVGQQNPDGETVNRPIGDVQRGESFTGPSLE
jgi:hypothetical protein